jgi:hypothetical protein
VSAKKKAKLKDVSAPKEGSVVNVRETRALPFVALLSNEDRAKIVGDDIPPALKPVAESLGVTKPSDTVEFSLSLGSLIFDVYHTQTEMPKAPLALERERAKRLSLSEELDKDTFDVPDDVKSILEKTLSEDSEWTKIGISTHFKVGEETRTLQLNSVALDIFHDTKKALMSIFL